MSLEPSTISVALTTFNGCPYIDEQLDSIAAQSRRPDEVVIGDDCSSDATASSAERFAAASGVPMRWQRNESRLGYVRNLEQVVRRCRGDIVVFADQDDVWAPHKLARIEAALCAEPDAWGVFSNGLFIDEHGAALPGTLFEKCVFNAAERDRFRSGGALAELVRRNVVTGATLAVRRSVVLSLLPFDAFWPHDYYVALACSGLSRLLVLDEPLIYYRRHSRQQIGFPAKTWQGVLRLVHGQSAAACRQEAHAFERLAARWVTLGMAETAPAIAMLRHKGQLLAERAEMRAHRRRAPRLMWRGVRDGAYRDFSIGWRQLVLDVLALGVGVDCAPSGWQRRCRSSQRSGR